MVPPFRNDTLAVSILKFDIAYIRSYNVLSSCSLQSLTQGVHDDIHPVGIDELCVDAHT